MTIPTDIRAVMIDLDGTLLDTIPDLAAAANATLAEIGRPLLGIDTIKTFVGKGIPNLVKRCLTVGLYAEAEPSEGELERVLPIFKRHYGAVNGRETRIYPGVLEGLDSFRAQGLKLGCVTNKAAAFTEPLLETVGLRRYFQVVVSGDTLAEKKPHPAPLLHICRALGVAPEEALLIGDSGNDVEAARRAGCPVVCVDYGYNEGADVHDLDCDAIVSSLGEVASVLAAAVQDSKSRVL
jgi:phosphoglycolate phosphatase